MEQFMGDIMLTALPFAPRGYAFCHGQLLGVHQYPGLFNLLGTAYGGDGSTTFALPDMRGRGAVGTGQDNALGNLKRGQATGWSGNRMEPETMPNHNHPGKVLLGDAASPSPKGSGAYISAGGSTEQVFSSSPGGQYLNNDTLQNDETGGGGVAADFSVLEPSLSLNYCISLQGIYPSPSNNETDQKEETTEDSVGILDDYVLMCTIEFFAGNFVPRGYMSCSGQELLITDYKDIFSLIGNTYGGDGLTNFKLPDLRGCYPIGPDARTDGPAGVRALGSVAGEYEHSITTEEMPAHLHLGGLQLGGGLRKNDIAKDSYPAARTEVQVYQAYQPDVTTTVNTAAGSVVLGSVGKGEAFNLRSPYLGLTAAIAIAGTYPSKP